VVQALIKKLEDLFGVVIVYDMHSYNWRRWDREVPVINLGTTNINNERFGESVEEWRKSLSELILPNEIEATSKINNTFYGNGYFLKYITNNFKNTLVLATEFKKIYCDELRQIIYPEVVTAIEKQLQIKVVDHADSFYKAHSK
jgi:predicted MPP superfamily phosphohydrolase